MRVWPAGALSSFRACDSTERQRARLIPCAPAQNPAAQEMLASWSDPFIARFQDCGAAALVELSVIESRVREDSHHAVAPLQAALCQYVASAGRRQLSDSDSRLRGARWGPKKFNM